jgi:hypothetical protein
MKPFRLAQLLLLPVVALCGLRSSGQVNVITWHNDNARTGQNTYETVLTRDLVGNQNSFGKLCSSTVDGMVHAQPLVVHVTIGSNAYTAVFVVTQNDTVYAFDGINYKAGHPCTQVAMRHLPPSGYLAAGNGILGTPVIDTNTNTLYLVAESKDSSDTLRHQIYALDITQASLPDKVAPVQIAGGSFSSKTEVQRPALLGLTSSPGGPLRNVYVSFSRTPGPGANKHGWIFSYDAATLSRQGVYCDTCWSGATNPTGAGIWQSGGGPAAGIDSSGGQTYVYFGTGEGTFDLDSGGQDASNTFVKMTPDLTTVAGFFTPADQACRSCPQLGSEHDLDFGSGGVMLIPNGLLPNYPYIAVIADKEGYIWVVDRENPGGYQGNNTGSCPSLVCRGTNRNLETLKASANQFLSSAAYWNRNLYYGAQNTVLKEYELANAACSKGEPPVCSSQVSAPVNFPYGTTPSVSSNGTADGIVWAIKGNGQEPSTSPGTLYAFTTDTLAQLYNSNQCTIGGVSKDQPGAATTFSVPTIANGRVYIGTQGGKTGSSGGFHMYGPISRSCD